MLLCSFVPSEHQWRRQETIDSCLQERVAAANAAQRRKQLVTGLTAAFRACGYCRERKVRSKSQAVSTRMKRCW